MCREQLKDIKTGDDGFWTLASGKKAFFYISENSNKGWSHVFHTESWLLSCVLDKHFVYLILNFENEKDT